MPTSKQTRDRIKYAQKGDEAISAGAREIQVKLWKRVNQLIGQLKQVEGKIANTASNYSLLGQLNAIQREIKDGPKRKLIRQIVQGLIQQESLIKSYFSDVVKLESKTISKKVHSQLLNRIGYDGKGFVSRGVLKDLWDDDAEIRQIKAQTVKAIASGKAWGEFQKEMSSFVNGTPGQKQGVTEAHFRTATLDIYNQNDRALTKQYADEFDLQWFIFQGGLMKSTRDFCRARNNRVFSRKQVEEWSKLTFDGKPAVYNPFMDVGGFNCRHVLDPISDEMKEELMKSSPEMFGDLPPADPKPTPPPPENKPEPKPEPKVTPPPDPEPKKERPEKKPAEKTSTGSDIDKKKRSQVEKEEGIIRKGKKIDPSSIHGKSLEIVERVTREQNFESAALYDADGKFVFFKNGKSNNVGFTTEEATLAAGKILTHNHPGSASFSDADVKFLLRYKVKELRAVGDEWTYSMKITKDTNFHDVGGLLRDIRDDVDDKYKELLKGKRYLTPESNAAAREKFENYEDYKKEYMRLKKLDDAVLKWSYHESSNEVMEILAKKINITYTREPWKKPK